MTRAIALAGLATYVCQTPIDHNGEKLPVGSPIELDTAAAQALLNVDAIAHSDGNAAQVLQTKTDGVAALLEDLDRRDQQLDQARQEIAQLRQAAADQQAAAATELAGLQATLAQLRQAAADAQSAAGAEVESLRGQVSSAGLKVADLEGENQKLRDDLAAAKAAQAVKSPAASKRA